jgi:hypothetical protein
LAGIALELGALAFLGYVVMQRRGSDERPPPLPTGPDVVPSTDETTPHGDETEDFITENADESARYYRASGQGVELRAGFYSDGRIRLADAQNRRFAGMLQGNHADMLEIESNEWSEVFLQVTPTGRMQLEVRGGPYDAHLLTCDPSRPPSGKNN